MERELTGSSVNWCDRHVYNVPRKLDRQLRSFGTISSILIFAHFCLGNGVHLSLRSIPSDCAGVAALDIIIAQLARIIHED